MSSKNTVPFVSIDDRPPASVRAVILARTSEVAGKEKDVEAQVVTCQEFIGTLGWTLVRPPYAYAEMKSGYRNVERPVLDEVLRLAQAGEIDVVVCREFERVARVKMRRWAAVAQAESFGVAFRFANLPPRGKLDDTTEGRLVAAFLEEYGEMERDRIRERTLPGLMRRLQSGIPGGPHPPYGYRWPHLTPGQEPTTRRKQGSYDTSRYEVDPNALRFARSVCCRGRAGHELPRSHH